MPTLIQLAAYSFQELDAYIQQQILNRYHNQFEKEFRSKVCADITKDLQRLRAINISVSVLQECFSFDLTPSQVAKLTKKQDRRRGLIRYQVSSQSIGHNISPDSPLINLANSGKAPLLKKLEDTITRAKKETKAMEKTCADNAREYAEAQKYLKDGTEINEDQILSDIVSMNRKLEDMRSQLYDIERLLERRGQCDRY